jgi:hypothetical protein
MLLGKAEQVLDPGESNRPCGSRAQAGQGWPGHRKLLCPSVTSVLTQEPRQSAEESHSHQTPWPLLPQFPHLYRALEAPSCGLLA